MLTNEQKQFRQTGVGASETATLLGLDPYKSPIDIYLKKLGLVEEIQDNIHIKRGNFLEPALREWVSVELGIKFYPCKTRNMEGNPLVLATPDGISNDDKIVIEIKSPGPRTYHEWSETEAPDKYVIQLSQQMMVYDVEYGYIVALIGGELKLYKYTRDPELEKTIVDVITNFWNNHVIPKIPPEPDGMSNYSDFIKTKFPKNQGQLITASNEQEELIAQFASCKKTIEQLEKELEETKQKIQLAIGDADGIESAALGKITWRNNKDSERIDYKGLIEAVKPDIELVKSYTQTTPGARVFRFWPNKKG